jgi:hypothetical protein
MKANAGDHIVVRGNKVGQPDRQCEVLEARGDDGGSPYFVRWDDGSEALIYPGSDAVVARASASRRRRNSN